MDNNIKNWVPNCVFLKRKDTYEKVNIDDILWIEACGSSLMIYTNSNRKYILSLNLKKFTSQITHDMLVRVHRSYIVNMTQVEAIKGRQLVVNGRAIPFSDNYVPHIGNYLPVVRTI